MRKLTSSKIALVWIGHSLAAQSLPDWNLVFTQPSAARASMNMAFDSRRQVTVMFGGRDGSNTSLSDTYEYAQTSWSKVLTPNSPPARYWAGMAYDDLRGRTVLFGGNQNDSFIFNDTWEYDGSDWRSILTAHSPPAQDGLSMAYDSCRQKAVVLTAFPRPTETWEYDGVDWTKVNTSAAPPARRLAALVFDRSRCRTILFGGLPAGPLIALSDTWEYDGATWTKINTAVSPPGRWAHGIAFDTKRGRAVLFGGYGPVYPTGQPTNDTWEYDGVGWLQVFPRGLPGVREQHGMAYDLIRERIVMLGGFGGGDGGAWEYTTITPCTYSLAPSGQSFGAQGGVGSFTVNTASACSWSAARSATWITVLPSALRGTGKVNYAIAANIGGARTGTISIGGQNYTINQQGFTCSYSIGPKFAAPSNTGGNVNVSVSAPGGCPWTAVSNAPWLTVNSGTSGSGGGVVVLRVAPNAGGTRSGTATIASQAFSVTQGTGTCGALDVSSQMQLTRSGLSYIFPSSYLYSSSIAVTNRSGSPVFGPVWIVLVGLPTNLGFPNDSGLNGNQRLTTCFSSPGDYLLLVSGFDMAPGQSTSIPLAFFSQRLGGVSQFSTKVLSGTPTR